MKCPNCGIECPPGALECAGCGVIFAKFLAKKERDERAIESAPLLEDKTRIPVIDKRMGRLVAGGLVILWLAAFGLYYFRVIHGARGEMDGETPTSVLMRDPETGDLKRIPVVLAPSAGRRRGEASKH